MSFSEDRHRSAQFGVSLGLKSLQCACFLIGKDQWDIVSFRAMVSMSERESECEKRLTIPLAVVVLRLVALDSLLELEAIASVAEWIALILRLVLGDTALNLETTLGLVLALTSVTNDDAGVASVHVDVRTSRRERCTSGVDSCSFSHSRDGHWCRVHEAGVRGCGSRSSLDGRDCHSRRRQVVAGHGVVD